jgi:hypothetical protein
VDGQLAAALLLGVTFGWSGIVKIAGAERWKQAVRRYRLPRLLKVIAILAVPWLELGVAALVASGHERAAAGVALAMLAPFSAAIVRLRIVNHAVAVPCGCLGVRGRVRDYRVLLLRNAALAVVALFVLAGGPDSSDALSLVPLIAVVTVGCAAWSGWQVASSGARQSVN